MIRSGLCSITFRKHSTSEILKLAEASGIAGIEWGGDVHLPPGDPGLARDLRRDTANAGLQACSYGSYFRCDTEAGPFAPVAGTADALGAPVIRVWAGRRGSEEADAAYREEVASVLRDAVDLATKAGITVALEYHGQTLTDTRESAHRLLEEVGRDALKLYWQPRTGGRFEEDQVELEAALPHLSHVHVFHWLRDAEGRIDRRPLTEGVAAWTDHLSRIAAIGGDRFAILEFVRQGSEEIFREDAATLRRLLEATQAAQ